MPKQNQTQTVNINTNKKNYTPWIILGVVVLIILIIAGSISGTYNSLITQEENVNQKWNNVESAYQRRADLIPNIVETVKGASDFEQETLTAVVNARAKATSITATKDLVNNPEAFQKFQEAQGELSGALSKLLVSVERYPELKATQAYRDLMVSLEGTENRIKIERDNYNLAVKEYNVIVRRFPNNIIAGMFGFDKKEGFQADKGAEKVVEVKF